ncbi:MAG: D-alanyl-D-alanine carboxypeptidase [Acidobacteria bacterium]|nr:D-alanyl-D-alanine carboxypeptidase [Acidobacteriota bacterium]
MLVGIVPAAASAQTAKSGAKVTAAKRAQRTSLARAAALARARRAAAARLAEEARQPRFKTDDAGNLVPDVRAAAAIIYNPETGDILWEANSHDQRSIASLTKIMTAVTFIADDPDLTQTVKVTRADVMRASTTHLRAGDVLTYSDLLHLTLIASDNAAARVLARTSEGGTEAFVGRMNQMAAHLGLTNTRYADPSGLDARNVSSAYDLSHLIAFATSDERLGPIMRTQAYEARTNRGVVAIHNTNRLLGTEGVNVIGGKTGFISKAGYCLATLLQVPQGAPLAVVVLGAANSTLRFAEARHLFNWAVEKTSGLLNRAATVPNLLNAASSPLVQNRD